MSFDSHAINDSNSVVLNRVMYFLDKDVCYFRIYCISKRVQNMDSQLFQHIPLKLRVTKPMEN